MTQSVINRRKTGHLTEQKSIATATATVWGPPPLFGRDLFSELNSVKAAGAVR
jgi:hypothetical protein